MIQYLFSSLYDNVCGYQFELIERICLLENCGFQPFSKYIKVFMWLELYHILSYITLKKMACFETIESLEDIINKSDLTRLVIREYVLVNVIVFVTKTMGWVQKGICTHPCEWRS